MFPMFAYLSRTAFRRWLLLADKIIIKEVLAGSAGQFFHVHSRLAKTGLVIPAFAFGLKSKESQQDVEKRLLDQADELFDQYKFRELLSLLKSVKSWETNSELLWRIARCQYHLLKFRGDKGSDDFLNAMKSALDNAEKAISLDATCGSGHKWMAIILDEFASLHGTKARIGQLLKVREHMEQAIKYSPQDATSYYLLGEWHYSCSSVSWFERNIAKVLFGELPQASYETALDNFEKAEQLDPNFYSKNKLMIAKTLLALNKDKERAVALLKDIYARYRSSTKWDDAEAFNSACDLLTNLGELKK